MKPNAGLRDFILVWLGQLISGVGSRLTSFALGLWVLDTTHSLTRFAWVFVAMAVPALLVSPLAGALVDRWDRRRTMIACEAISAGAMLALAALMATGRCELWHAYTIVAVTALANAFLQPAYSASVPLLASGERLERLNGMVQTGVAVAQLGGPVLAGVLYTFLPLQGLLIVDALTYVAGLAFLLASRIPRPAPSGEEPQSLWREAADGWRYVADRAGLLGLLLVFGLGNFLFGIASIVITPLVRSVATPAQLGVQMSVGGAGLLLGGLAISLWGGPRRRIDAVLGGYLFAGLMLAIHGLAPSYPLLLVAGFLFFIGIPTIHSCNAALWQSKVPAHLQGRCFAIQRVLSEAAMPLGFCLAGPLADRVFEPLLAPTGALAPTVGAVIGTGPGRGLGFMFIVLGLGMTAMAVGAWLVRPIRRVESDLPDAPVQLDPTAAYAA